MNEEESPKDSGGDEHPHASWILLAVVGLIAGLAPIGLAAFITDVPAMTHAMPAVLPFWVVTGAATAFSFCTRKSKVASVIVFVICGLAVLNLAGCALEFARIDRALG